jgi:predicted kinase
MRKWIRNRVKKNSSDTRSQTPQEPPLQPTFLDREGVYKHEAEPAQHTEFESQPEQDPADQEETAPETGAEGAESDAAPRRRRRSRGGRNRRRGNRPEAPALPVEPGEATGEAAEVEGVPEGDGTGSAAQAKPVEPKKGKGAVILAIGLPGSGKSSWFRRHNILPLSSDLVRGLLFDDATEQHFQDLVFSTLRYMLRMRMQAGRELNYIDATNLSPRERNSWIRMAKDFGYEAQAVFFDVPTEICMERNRKRERNVPDEIMLRMAAKLRPPKFDEGFSKITVVRLKGAPPSGAGPTDNEDGE